MVKIPCSRAFFNPAGPHCHTFNSPESSHLLTFTSFDFNCYLPIHHGLAIYTLYLTLPSHMARVRRKFHAVRIFYALIYYSSVELQYGSIQRWLWFQWASYLASGQNQVPGPRARHLAHIRKSISCSTRVRELLRVEFQSVQSQSDAKSWGQLHSLLHCLILYFFQLKTRPTQRSHHG